MTITIPSGRTLPLKAKAGGGFQSNGIADSVIQIAFTLNQAQAIFAAMNTEPAPVDAIWASALAPDQSDAELTQDGSEGSPYSLRRAIYSATPGKQVLLKDDGTYVLSDIIQTASQSAEDTYIQPSPNIIPWNMVEPTSSAERIVFRGEPSTCPAIDFTNTAIDISMDFLEFAYLRIDNAASAFLLASSANYGGACQGTYIHHVCGDFSRQIGGASNVGFIQLSSSADNGEKPVIEYCFIKGDNSSENQNNACFYVDKTNKFTARNNYFYGVQAHVVYFKSGNNPSDVGGIGSVDITFENNFCDGNVDWAGSGGDILNNVVTGNLRVIADAGGVSYMQDSNTIRKNTVIGRIELSKLDWNSENNNVQDNIMDQLYIQSGGSSGTPLDPATNTNTSDYNLINATDDGQRFLWDTALNEPAQFKTLSEWQSYISLDINSAVAASQLVGNGTYSTLSDFDLVGGSVGLTLSSTGGPVGADTSLVGVQ